MFLGQPCNKDGNFVHPLTKPTPAPPLDATDNNPWHPFEGRLDFDWANYQFVELQSSEGKVNRGLDLWLAATLVRDGADSVPWRTADDMYMTIDSIREGSADWQTISFRYNGPMPANPPRWMLETYELNTRDTLVVMEQQLATAAFENKIDYVPYKHYDAKGNRIYSNLMSGRWAYKQAVRDSIMSPFRLFMTIFRI